MGYQLPVREKVTGMITAEYAAQRRREVEHEALHFSWGYVAGARKTVDPDVLERFADSYADLYTAYLVDDSRPYPGLLTSLIDWLAKQ